MFGCIFLTCLKPTAYEDLSNCSPLWLIDFSDFFYTILYLLCNAEAKYSALRLENSIYVGGYLIRRRQEAWSHNLHGSYDDLGNSV